ncbi:MAG: hypothetical protein RL119_653 [Actinomycetota bacterium]
MNPSKILIIDGGLSTALEELGVDISGPLWTARAVIESRNELAQAHRRFAEAGASFVTTASYQCGVEHFEALGQSPSQARNTLLATTAIAREGVRLHGTQVAASVGPYGASLADGSEYHGDYGTSFATVEKYHRRKLEVLVESEPDAFAVETQLRTDEVRSIASQLMDLGSPPAWFSFGFRDESTTHGGQSVQDMVEAVVDYPNLLALGVNCTAPHLVTAILQQVAAAAPGIPLIAYPNHGGQWDPNDRSWVRPSGDVFGLQRLLEWQSAGALYIGGCCGIGPREIADLAQVFDGFSEIEPKNGNQ